MSVSAGQSSVTEQAGYQTFKGQGFLVQSCDWASSAVMEVLATGTTLYEWASRQTLTAEMRGRGAVYALVLPDTDVEVVVRRNRHGGLLRALTGELFLRPTRVAQELAISRRLVAAGIPTPEIVACAEYPLLGFLARCDVMTRRLPAGGDAPERWQQITDTNERDAMVQAIAGLLRALAAAGAWHADLNLKNIYLAGSGTTLTAYLLDVDRVTFPVTADIAERNLNRLTRSIRKWRERWGLDFDEAALLQLTALSRKSEG